MLDIFHGSEHLSDCAKMHYGEGAAAKAWVDGGRRALLTAGAAGVQEHLAAARAGARSAPKRRALAEVTRYFARLAQGQSIGSGLVEGACKQVIGRRRKQTGARWRVRRANRMATLCCTFHSDTWAVYWGHQLN